ncbi:hypothetical protein RRG08_059052 [Elysia crispata]|uniref:Uncharacterized protein n=1 Tax=Elysia crispata TaxID=231223 RepID=A0AAE0ZDR5_9GAST|nr:hypothetical protein RRG08_059052 [Elysia crispata]
MTLLCCPKHEKNSQNVSVFPWCTHHTRSFQASVMPARENHNRFGSSLAVTRIIDDYQAQGPEKDAALPHKSMALAAPLNYWQPQFGLADLNPRGGSG